MSPGFLVQHTKIKHLGLKYPCIRSQVDSHNYKELQRHVNTTNVNIRQQFNLTNHKESKYEGIRYPCKNAGMQQ